MSYKITKARFLNQKIKINDFNFDSENNAINQVLLQNQADKKTITRILKGKEQIQDGRFLVDGLDLVNPKFVKKTSSFIYTDTYIERFIPSKMILVLSSLFNPNFFRNARINYLRTKYDYLAFNSSKENITEFHLKQAMDKSISEFIQSETRAEEKTLTEWQEQMSKFNINQSNKIFGNHNSVLKVVARSYYKELAKLQAYNLTLTFYQALWDDVYKFNSLRNSCTCEYNAKKSSNKEVRKMKHQLNYNQTKYVVKKQLKYISIRITEHRTLIYRQKLLVKQLKKQFNLELKKFYTLQELTKDQQSVFNKQLNNWRKLNQDTTDIFVKNQQHYFFKTLQKNAQYIAKVLVVQIHHYHEKVLSKALKYSTKGEYKIKKKNYKNKIVGVVKQAIEYNKEQMEKYGINLDWFLKSTFKLSSLNILFVKILRSINLNRENIFFMDFVHLLSANDFDKFIETLNNIKKDNPRFCFTILDSHANKFPYLDQKIYSEYEEHFNSVKLVDLINQYPKEYRTELFGTKNLFRYQYKNNHLKIYNKKEPYHQEGLPEKGYAFINPFEMKYEPTSSKTAQDKIAVITDIKKAPYYNDPNMYYCRNQKGYKFFFYDNDHLDLKNVGRGIITFDLDSISEFIETR
ncbi:hypothetical protein [Mesoplasma lactucae]|uniref:Uncharacterized protein n=1 Tax=Mesoplasma lactucae ATCC 49193 TaxID=81460 RepID=A0A291ISQ5_9MOLU|nr:hypothetical protein [Mesoplasma lactucae]ATG97758.1 hypothetical protein CP520_03410 [Mesoplasma lactucae ATCC 49193]ATZ20465.1 hypothetical protein MLACT_v1c06440 [Mesoplasma lactucae ATCC 49193]MCL8216637.1 hypothetical protein [Mesoplasma lactucae ATCC 49193]